MQRFRVVNLGQPITPAARQRLPCPPVEAPDPKRNCARTQDGGVICSDGQYYPPYCTAPPVTQEAPARYVRQGPFAFPQPPEASLTSEVGGTFPWVAVGIAAAGAVVATIFS